MGILLCKEQARRQQGVFLFRDFFCSSDLRVARGISEGTAVWDIVLRNTITLCNSFDVFPWGDNVFSFLLIFIYAYIVIGRATREAAN